jgi:hypothetical protein
MRAPSRARPPSRPRRSLNPTRESFLRAPSRRRVVVARRASRVVVCAVTRAKKRAPRARDHEKARAIARARDCRRRRSRVSLYESLSAPSHPSPRDLIRSRRRDPRVATRVDRRAAARARRRRATRDARETATMTARADDAIETLDLADGADPLRAVLDACDRELRAFLTRKYASEALDAFPRCARTKSADACVQWAQFASKRKMNPKEVAEEVAREFGEEVAKRPRRGAIVGCEAAGVYVNLKMNRPMVFEATMKAVARRGGKFGHTDAAKGKRVIIEHTSSNPNAPLHIGNLRNVMIGAHLSRMMKACGHDVKEAFYVNDLGAQIGLTALAYSRIYDKMTPFMKIDHWIGAMYAVMNTCQELQQVGVKPGELEVRARSRRA